MSYFNIVAETNENTVVTTYEPLPKRPEAYQSEAALEREFIKLLREQGYEDKTIHNSDEMVTNGSGFSCPRLPTPTSTLWKRPARSRRTTCRC